MRYMGAAADFLGEITDRIDLDLFLVLVAEKGDRPCCGGLFQAESLEGFPVTGNFCFY